MTKKELIEKVQKRLGDFGKSDMTEAVDIVFDAMKDCLIQGERIELRGFGVFEVKGHRPRLARNPKTGAEVTVPAKRLPYFKVGKELKEMVDY